MEKTIKTLLFCSILASFFGSVSPTRQTLRAPAGFRDAAEKTFGVRQAPRGRAMTAREFFAAKRRAKNMRKLKANLPIFDEPTAYEQIRDTFKKVLLGAGIGIGLLFLYKNPAVAKTIWGVCKETIKAGYYGARYVALRLWSSIRN